MDEDGGKDPEDPGTEDPAVATKKRQSRKSSAYHKAKKAALKDGKSNEEALALAKAVFCS